MERLTIVVLVYESLDDTLECLESIGKAGLLGRTLLVDNASSPAVESGIKARHPGLRYVRNGENLGFAGGNNVGIRMAMAEGAEYVFVLNNDTVINPDTLPLLLAYMDSHPEAGAISPVNYYYSDAGRVWQSGVELRDPVRHRGFDRALEGGGPAPAYREVDYLPGSSILFRSRALAGTGLFDEWFFLTFEETDLCFRLKRAGWKVIASMEASIRHKVSGTFSKFPYLSDFFMLRNRLRFVRKNFPRRILAAAALHWAGSIFLKLGKRLLRMDFKGVRILYLAVKHALFMRHGSLLPVLEAIGSRARPGRLSRT